jgi:hypothetical protein
VALDDVANEGRLTVTARTRQVELAAAIHGAIAIVVSLALEEPLISHLPRLPKAIDAQFAGTTQLAIGIC